MTLTAANVCTTSLQSRVPTTGRSPLSPNVAVKVGTMGKRPSSWLSRTMTPRWAWRFLPQLIEGPLLACGVGPQEAVGGPVGAHATAEAEVTHGRLTHADARSLVQEVGQGRMSPIGALEAARPRPLAHPVQDEGRERLGNQGRSARRPLNLQPLQAPCPVACQETLDIAHWFNPRPTTNSSGP